MHLFLFPTLAFLGLVLIGGGFSERVLAASSDADMIIAECKKRTGLSDTSCVSLLKRYMTVERCQEYTKLSAKECEEKIKSLKEDPKFQGKQEAPKTSTSLTPSRSLVPMPPVAVIQPSSNLRERILQAKREKEQRFALIQGETNAMIAYLKEQGRETTNLEVMVKEFEQKKQSTLLAYDQYQSIVESTSSTENFSLEGPRQTVLRVLRDTTEYYRSVLLPEVRRQAVASP